MSQTRNEAAERLRRVGYLDHTYIQDEDDPAFGEPLSPLLDEARAAERRALVERIEERFKYWPKDEALRDFLAVVREVAR